MFANFSLLTRLFISYIVLLVVALTTVLVALLLFFSARPAPAEPTFNRLAAIVQGINIRDLLDEFAPTEQRIPRAFDRLQEILDNFADTRKVRVMWLASINDEDIVIYDTAQIFPAQTELVVNNESFFSSNLEQTLLPGSNQLYGSFNDPDGTEWLFGGIARDTRLAGRRNFMSVFMVAEPRPTLSLREVLEQFRIAIFPPLLQAAALGLVVSLAMAAFISRSFVTPLRNLLRGVNAVTQGHYEQKVPEIGPPEVRQLASEFNIMSEEVRSTQQAQRDFLANVSHDLKTPLTSIQGYSQAILDGAAKDPAQAARIIYDEAGRLNRLVVELTDLIRMQAGGLLLKQTSLQLNDIVHAIAERLQVVADKKNVEVIVQTRPLPPIIGDGDRLAQVLTNLLSNAIKFTPGKGRVIVSTLPHPDGVELLVQDTGIGIPPEDLPRIFERFYQVDKARGPARGTGLGLAIVQQIVHAHQGSIHVHSAGPNTGTTVRVVLPLRPDEARTSA